MWGPVCRKFIWISSITPVMIIIFLRIHGINVNSNTIIIVIINSQSVCHPSTQAYVLTTCWRVLPKAPVSARLSDAFVPKLKLAISRCLRTTKPTNLGLSLQFSTLEHSLRLLPTLQRSCGLPLIVLANDRRSWEARWRLVARPILVMKQLRHHHDSHRSGRASLLCTSPDRRRSRTPLTQLWAWGCPLKEKYRLCTLGQVTVNISSSNSRNNNVTSYSYKRGRVRKLSRNIPVIY